MYPPVFSCKMYCLWEFVSTCPSHDFILWFYMHNSIVSHNTLLCPPFKWDNYFLIIREFLKWELIIIMNRIHHMAFALLCNIHVCTCTLNSIYMYWVDLYWELQSTYMYMYMFVCTLAEYVVRILLKTCVYVCTCTHVCLSFFWCTVVL